MPQSDVGCGTPSLLLAVPYKAHEAALRTSGTRPAKKWLGHSLALGLPLTDTFGLSLVKRQEPRHAHCFAIVENAAPWRCCEGKEAVLHAAISARVRLSSSSSCLRASVWTKHPALR